MCNANLKSNKDRIWNTSTSEERERIKIFWLSLSEEERRSLVKVEKEAVAGTTSRKGNADSTVKPVNGSQKGAESRSKGDILQEKALQNWTISEPMGGRMSDVDPIFSADEK